MAEREQREVVSRRARPSKAPLSQGVIVTAALDLLSQDGMAGLSLRKVAAALDTGAASLYVYVANLDELLALVLDRVLVEVERPSDPEGDWREQLKTVLQSYFRVLYERPGLAQVALRTQAAGPGMAGLTETLLALLTRGGLDLARAAWALDLLLLHSAALAAEQDNRRFTNEEILRRMQGTMDSLPAEDYPNIHAAGAELYTGTRERYEWALDALINGVMATPRP
jgi:AcrR family transcriptional regulator